MPGTGGSLAFLTCAISSSERKVLASRPKRALVDPGSGAFSIRSTADFQDARPQPSGLSASLPPRARNGTNQCAKLTGLADIAPKSSHMAGWCQNFVNSQYFS
jgi:hypothetical protein